MQVDPPFLLRLVVSQGEQIVSRPYLSNLVTGVVNRDDETCEFAKVVKNFATEAAPCEVLERLSLSAAAADI